MLRIPLQVAGVGVEILAGAELGRVHEDRHHDEAGQLPGPVHQRQVALVQRAHGRDEPDGLRGEPDRLRPAGTLPPLP